MTKQRVIIQNITPCVDNGKYAAKRVEGDTVHVHAAIFADGHDEIKAQLHYKFEKQKSYSIVDLKHLQNDEWECKFKVDKIGHYSFFISGWIDAGNTWLHNFSRKFNANLNMMVELMSAAVLLEQIAPKLKAKDKTKLKKWASIFNDKKQYDAAIEIVNSEDFREVLIQNPLIENETLSETLEIICERKRSEFSTWYEFFPRSAVEMEGVHGNFIDCEKRLSFISSLGFDVLYFPPIHPIGVSFRKGKNNSTVAGAHEPGCPWAIGSAKGGHKDILQELGTFDEFASLVNKANQLGIEIAMDLAYQCSPDHPYVKQHPQWFKWRPDGTVQYAENPPKKYQDVLPINFESDDWKNLWNELKSIVTFWIEKGITIFRVDNPHTKSFAFWEWMIAEVKKKYPNTIFLAEAFTRPKIMAQLAKIGFTQSYTYFTWRTTKQEIVDYVNELAQTNSRNYFRPNFWPNTPDILPYDIQNTNFEHNAIRFILASTLSASYGIYGPVFDLLVTKPFPNKEEYLDSEKYEARHWDWHTMTPMRQLIQQVNKIRHTNSALQSSFNTLFCDNDNNYLLSYLKCNEEKTNLIFVVINLDAKYAQSGFVKLPLEQLGIVEGTEIKLHDLLTGEIYTWNKQFNFVMLEPNKQAAHIFELSW